MLSGAQGNDEKNTISLTNSILVCPTRMADAHEPTMSSFDDPTIASQLRRTLDAFASNAWRDAAPSERLPMVARVIGFIGVQLLGAFTRATPWALDRANRINGFFQHLDVMHIGRSYQRLRHAS